MSSDGEIKWVENEFHSATGKTPKSQVWGIAVPPPLWVDGLSRVETEKAEWGRVEATLSCISYLAISHY